jgi:hypothetical protein
MQKLEVERWKLEKDAIVRRRIAAECGDPRRFPLPISGSPNLQPLSLQKLEIGRWRLEKEGKKIARDRIAAERGDPQNHRRLPLAISGSDNLQSPSNLPALAFKLSSLIFNLRDSGFNL